ncbi:PadR family transcriptional regulator [Pseudarthrobacter sp. P1]|uniref:PadR family transcriptional regulator n=1 Tax=Pseudarthrobacter sp. P1 TaxID=3418418 RepID=UPI003CE8A8B5
MSKRSPLALAVLALLVEAPMHPYRMRQLITERGKDEVINVTQRASLYNTIDRLVRDGLVQLMETSREGQRPERSVYEATSAGRDAAQAWMREMLTAPRPDYPEFTAALAHLPMIEPEQTAQCLRVRAASVAADVARLEAGMDEVKDWLPRLFLLDTELILEMRRTELRWITGLLADLDNGTIAWSHESVAAFGAIHHPHNPEDLSS